jgi:hypothetical protein
MKRLLAAILTLSMVLAIFPAASAKETFSLPDDSFSPMTESDGAIYGAYDVAIPTRASGRSAFATSTMDTILDLCTFKSEETVGEYVITMYTSETLPSYLHDCQEITDISVFNGFLYIYYATHDGSSVILCYDQNGLVDKGIRNDESNTVVYYNDGQYYQSETFIDGSQYEIPEADLQVINDLVENQEWEQLAGLRNYNVTFSVDGTFTVEPKALGVSTRGGIVGFSTESAALQDLKADWPMYTNKIMSTTAKYSQYLRTNVQTRITESRNGYVRKTFNFLTFGATTAATLIGLGLGVTQANVVITIAKAAGAVFTASNTLAYQLTIVKSANYGYYGDKAAYVYDSTRHNAYVTILRYSGQGEFHGGYDNRGVFTWIDFASPSCYNTSSTTMTNLAISLYDEALYSGSGICWLYS